MKLSAFTLAACTLAAASERNVRRQYTATPGRSVQAATPPPPPPVSPPAVNSPPGNPPPTTPPPSTPPPTTPPAVKPGNSPSVSPPPVKPVSPPVGNTAAAAPGPVAGAAPKAASAKSGFVKVDGTHFQIDGKTQYLFGTNCYWCSKLQKDEDVNFVMKNIASAGLKILRVWAFDDIVEKPKDNTTIWFQLLKSDGPSEINEGPNGLGRLDTVVKAAEANGLKLILPLVNSWPDYGGIPAYSKAFGIDPKTWFTDRKAQQQYKTYVETVVKRYPTSTAIMAWELANEPRCTGCKDADAVVNWVKETSAFIKSLDPNRLVAVGDEGFGALAGAESSYLYSTAAGGYTWTDFLKIASIDFATLHLYPDSWAQPASFGESWVKLHGKACAEAKKPCFLEEYGGKNSCPTENPWQAAALSTPGYAGDAFWQYGDTLPSTKTKTHDDGNTVYFKQGNWNCMVADRIAKYKPQTAGPSKPPSK